MSTLRYFKNYNNYFNKIVKHDSTLADYMGYTYVDFPNKNFNPNDDITAEVIENWRESYDPDYVLVLNDAGTEIISRWFVTEVIRTRGKQYKYILRRDINADKYDIVTNAPILIERAMINDVNNPLLYNPEGFSFNQIKQREYLLKDASLSAWYILYFKKGLASKTISFTPYAGIEDHAISTPIAQSIFGSGTKNDTTNIIPMVTYGSDASWGWTITSHYQRRLAVNSDTYLDFYGLGYFNTDEDIWFDQKEDKVREQLTNAFTNQYTTLKTNVLTDEGLTSQLTTADREYLSWDNTLVKDSDNKMFRVHIVKNPYNVWKYKTGGTMVSTMKALINGTTLTKTGDWGDEAFAVKYNNIEYTFSYEEVTDANAFSIDIQWGTKEQTANSDYNIIAIPYSTIPFQPTQNIFGIPADWSKAFLQAIMGAYVADSELVDIQLLPYLPIQKAANSPVGHGVVLSPSEYTFVADTVQTGKGICLLYVSDANFSFNIAHTITTYNDAINRKVQSETQFVRLCSPNYQGAFEFNVARNGGVSYFNVDVTLKPYNPYIHINPNFGNLYGQDFNDARGLICGGDFSIPIWSTAWQQYELNNKNYQKIFDRQIQNMEFNQKQERIGEIAGLITGTVQGATQGAMAGGVSTGSPYGAIAGGLVGGISSAIGGAVDYNLMQERQAEQRNLATDMYKYQLGNIKALPYSLNKVTPLTYNNKIFPFIEIYDCTDEEKNLLRNFFTYQSMSVEAIGTIAEYIKDEPTFIKGRIIRLENLGLSSHEANEIYKEIMQGIYI